jgi:Helix-turn-helix
MPASKKVRTILAAVVERLATAVRADPRRTAEIERRAGFGQRYLAQLMRGQIALKVEHVYAILEALGLDPMEFWAGVHGVRPQQPQPFAVLIPQAQVPVSQEGEDRRLQGMESRLSRQIHEEIRAALGVKSAKKPRRRRTPAKKGDTKKDDNG